jgi:small subunit ribosomal protein S1
VAAEAQVSAATAAREAEAKLPDAPADAPADASSFSSEAESAGTLADDESLAALREQLSENE